MVARTGVDAHVLFQVMLEFEFLATVIEFALKPTQSTIPNPIIHSDDTMKFRHLHNLARQWEETYSDG